MIAKNIQASVKDEQYNFIFQTFLKKAFLKEMLETGNVLKKKIEVLDNFKKNYLKFDGETYILIQPDTNNKKIDL
jgi:hypothetical protein